MSLYQHSFEEFQYQKHFINPAYYFPYTSAYLHQKNPALPYLSNLPPITNPITSIQPTSIQPTLKNSFSPIYHKEPNTLQYLKDHYHSHTTVNT